MIMRELLTLEDVSAVLEAENLPHSTRQIYRYCTSRFKSVCPLVKSVNGQTLYHFRRVRAQDVPRLVAAVRAWKRRRLPRRGKGRR